MTQAGAGIQKKSNDGPPQVTPKTKDKLVVHCLIAVIGLLLIVIVMLILDKYNAGIYQAFESLSSSDVCIVTSDSEKFDCYPEDLGNEENCLKRGCCWRPHENAEFPPLNVPWCYYPKKFMGYHYTNISTSPDGVSALLERKRPSAYPGDVQLLKLDIQYQTDYRLRVKISDPLTDRFESPYPKLRPPSSGNPDRLNYKVDISYDKTGFVIKRPDGDVVFDTQDIGELIFSEQFLQISAKFSGKIFGLGEHQTRLRLNTNWTRLTLFNQDTIPIENMNLYGSHPFYLVLEPSGRSHGVYLHNSYAMDILLQPLPAITFRVIGGILDFYYFLGPTPSKVVEQYTELVGRPFMPPYWSMGFHLCRYGYKNVSHMETVLNRTLSAGIPVDTQWTDIDYMVNNNDFTVDTVKFRGFSLFIDRLHQANMHFIPILDPGVSASEARGSYPPYDQGLEQDVFIKNDNGSIFVGKVWNKGSTVFPDFTNPKTFIYWADLLQDLHNKIPFDGLWIDMNEPSNFYDGQFNGCPNNKYENPPYVPGVGGGKLYHKTVCMSAKQYLGRHYQVHNLHGIAEADATSRSLYNLLQKRTLIISRASSSGVGRYAGHWSGDVVSTWHDMELTIPQMLSFSLYGVSMMGSDICGFNGNTTKYLCLRWSQLGAFYPFSRNHNTDDGIDQDPVAMGDEVTIAAKNAMNVRYSLLPYLYTLFWRAHVYGETVARPLFFEFPNDNNTHDIDKSFLWGPSLLIVPVLKEFATTVDTYLPQGRWYDWYTQAGVESNGTSCTLAAGTDKIPVYIRGGSVLPTQEPASNTVESRANPIRLIAAFDTNLTASGSLYWDDGESLKTKERKTYGLLKFDLNSGNFTSQVIEWGLIEAPIVDHIQILGCIMHVKNVFINGTPTAFTWNSTNLVLSITSVQISLNTPFTVTWDASFI